MRKIGVIGVYAGTTGKVCKRLQEVGNEPVVQDAKISAKLKNELVEQGTGVEKFLPYLVKAARALEAQGVDFIVIPCITAHKLINEVRLAVKIPIKSVIEENKKRFGTDVGVLGTRVGVALFDGFKKPNEKDQQIVEDVIAGTAKPDQLLGVIQRLGVTQAILACGSLGGLVKQEDLPDVEIYDAFECL